MDERAHMTAPGPEKAGRVVAWITRPRPLWVYIVTAVLAVAVVGLLGYTARGMFESDEAPSASNARIDKWSRELAEDPSNTLARIELGYAYQQAGKLEEAVRQYDAVLAEEPRNVAALYNKGSILLSLNLDKEAEKTLWKALDAEPGHIQAATELGQMYAERGEYLSVLAAVRPVVELHPDSAELQYLTGYAYEKTGHPDWAAARYRLALEASPDHLEAREGLRRLGEVK